MPVNLRFLFHYQSDIHQSVTLSTYCLQIQICTDQSYSPSTVYSFLMWIKLVSSEKQLLLFLVSQTIQQLSFLSGVKASSNFSSGLRGRCDEGYLFALNYGGLCSIIIVFFLSLKDFSTYNYVGLSQSSFKFIPARIDRLRVFCQIT